MPALEHERLADKLEAAETTHDVVNPLQEWVQIVEMALHILHEFHLFNDIVFLPLELGIQILLCSLKYFFLLL